MHKNILTTLFCLITITCSAIDFYKPGDTLWVWAKNGLNIRDQPNAHSKILGKIENGAPVVSLDYPNHDFPYAVEEIKQRTEKISANETLEYPNFELAGYWAKIKYKGAVGYVFDGYLSKLQTIIGHQYDAPGNQDFHVLSLKKQAKVLKQIGKNEYGKDDRIFVRFIFDNGNLINISGGSGHWEKEMLFSNNLSLIEGYLIYAHTMKVETDDLLEKGEDYLKFKIDTGFLTIKKIGSLLVIYEEHAC